ncbi:LysM peptidoglycan-binding domain-containing protein [Arthrobacter sp.]|uniref:LysM peptidoglycan-binding domain-containing protein n=1 Tax=Arthrobacter sp. TaxID=1667 RepID=UPI002897B063|nr:LysM peptidoglycan-binding domain-containing protein [Arthrobacter sp.]
MTVQLAAPRTSLSFARTARITRFTRTDNVGRIASARRTDSATGAGGSFTTSTAAATPAKTSGPADARPVPQLRLTRRGRLLLIGAPIMLGGAALLTFIGFFTAPALAAGGNGELTRTQQVSISSGDSLWSLATEYAPERDPREVVADIMELNNLADAVVPAGAQLYIPVSR